MGTLPTTTKRTIEEILGSGLTSKKQKRFKSHKAPPNVSWKIVHVVTEIFLIGNSDIKGETLKKRRPDLLGLIIIVLLKATH